MKETDLLSVSGKRLAEREGPLLRPTLRVCQGRADARKAGERGLPAGASSGKADPADGPVTLEGRGSIQRMARTRLETVVGKARS